MGMQEWWPILIIVLLLFGARKLPDLARSLGSSVNEFKKGMNEGAKEDASSTEVRSTKTTTVSSTAATPSSNGPTSTRNDR
jgi:sec-independent protein translocase protein TatA